MTTVFHNSSLNTMTNGVVVVEQFNSCSQISTTSPPDGGTASPLPTNNSLESTVIVTRQKPLEMVVDEMLPKCEIREEVVVTAPQSEIDINISNVVCSFSLGCHLNLRNIASQGHNVEYRRETGMLTMKLRKPRITASIWSSGKITCTGAQSEGDAKSGARRVARIIQKLGFNAKFRNLRIVNVLGTCHMPFEIRINAFSQRYREAEYEPELHPGVTYKVKTLKATLKIFSTGSITVTAPNEENVGLAIEHIYPLVEEFQKEITNKDEWLRKRRLAALQQQQQICKRRRLNSSSNLSYSSDEEDFKEIESSISL